jgi:hypothetical protein
MGHTGNATTVRRAVAGLSLIAAPLLGLTGAALLPAFTGGMEGELAFIAAQPARWLTGLYLDLLAWPMMVVAMLGLLHLLRERAAILGHIGGGLLLIGSFFHGAVLGFQFVEAPLVVSGLNHAQIVAFSEQMYAHTAFSLLLLPFLSFYVGLLILAIALWRARIVPLWVAGVIVAAILVEFFGPPAFHTLLFQGLLLIALGWIGLAVLRMSNTQWEHGQAEAVNPGALLGQPVNLG